MSLRHEQDGRRLIDTLKKSLINVVRECVEDDVDLFYLYHPELVDAMSLHGEQSCAIGNYQTDGWPFNLSLAVKQTLYVLASQDHYVRKYLIYITDRNDSSHPLEKALHLNRKDMIEAHFILIGIGDQYDRGVMSLVSKLGEADGSVTCLHLPNAAALTPSLFKENTNGEIYACRTTDE